MLQLELTDEPHARRKAVIEQEDEAVEVEDPVFPIRLVEMEIHVARQRSRRGEALLLGALGYRRSRNHEEN